MSNMELLIIILGVTAAMGIPTYVILSIYNKIHLKFIDDNNYMYAKRLDENQLVSPLKFKYKNHDMTIETETVNFDKGITCYSLQRITYIINDKPVACLTLMEQCLHIHRVIFFNDINYDTSEFYKILRAARKEYMKKLMENSKTKSNSKEYKLY